MASNEELCARSKLVDGKLAGFVDVERPLRASGSGFLKVTQVRFGEEIWVAYSAGLYARTCRQDALQDQLFCHLKGKNQRRDAIGSICRSYLKAQCRLSSAWEGAYDPQFSVANAPVASSRA